MGQDEGRRKHTLDALGVTVWTRRDRPAESLVAAHATAARAPASTATLPATPSEDPAASAAQPPSVADAMPQRHLGISELDWEALAARVAACTACELHQGRLQTVFGVGNPQAKWMVIGEAPGAEEDKRGEPFVGRAGQLLTAMLAAAGLPRPEVYIANILKCRPPGNRDPLPAEVAQCEHYLARQIALVQPRLILAVGRIAAQNLLKVQTPLSRLRGQRHSYGPREVPVVVTYHPAYLLRSPGEKRRAWEDLQFARQIFATQAGTDE
jgi:DNA polymerase